MGTDELRTPVHENKNTVVVGIHRIRPLLDQAINNLKVNGFKSSDVSVLFPTGDRAGGFSPTAPELREEVDSAEIDGAVAGMGVPQFEAKRYVGRIKEGGMLISIHCDSDESRERAEMILRSTNALDISVARETPSHR
jgi:hypothetical protein